MTESGHAIARQFGKYRILAHLATGGMAEILLASQTSLGGFEKLMVIKRILPHLAQEDRFIEMFLDEARIAAVLNHPNVVQIFDLGRIDNQYFIAMEYLSGESLSALVKTSLLRGEFLPHELAAGVILQAAEGLHHAHRMTGKDGKPLNIVHRDISPQNIFVLYDGGVKVVDFGIARAAFRTTHTRTGTLKGKYSYMSPEHILGEELDARSDVFSLGIVFWECLTGRKLYRHESDLRLLQSITEEDAPSPRLINPSVPEALEQIALKALVRKREDRYQSATEFRTALAGYLKTIQKEADTMAISRFMQDLFTERMAEKRRLIEEAQVAEISPGDNLFAELQDGHSDTEQSMPEVTPPAVAVATTPSRLPKQNRFVLVALFAFMLLGGGLTTAYLVWSEGKTPEPLPKTTEAVAPEPASEPVFSVDGGEIAGSLSPADPNHVSATVAEDRDRRPDHKRKPPRRGDRDKPGHRGDRDGAGTAVAKVEPDIDKTPPVKPPPVKGPPGTLRLFTSPWTDIYYEGKKLGQTPLVDVELPSGRIRLRAVNKEMEIDEWITVEIKPGEKVIKRYNF